MISITGITHTGILTCEKDVWLQICMLQWLHKTPLSSYTVATGHPAHCQVSPPAMGQLSPCEPGLPVRGRGTRSHPATAMSTSLLWLQLNRSHVRCGHCSHQCFPEVTMAVMIQTEPSAARRCWVAQSPQKLGRLQALLCLSLHQLPEQAQVRQMLCTWTNAHL